MFSRRNRRLWRWKRNYEILVINYVYDGSLLLSNLITKNNQCNILYKFNWLLFRKKLELLIICNYILLAASIKVLLVIYIFPIELNNFSNDRRLQKEDGLRYCSRFSSNHTYVILVLVKTAGRPLPIGKVEIFIFRRCRFKRPVCSAYQLHFPFSQIFWDGASQLLPISLFKFPQISSDIPSIQ